MRRLLVLAPVAGVNQNLDLTDPEQARKMVEDAVAAYGGLDVVYNNAAIQYFAW